MNNESKNLSLVLVVTAFFLFVATLFAWSVFPEYIWLTVFFGVLLVLDLGFLIKTSQSAMKSRTVAYGANSAVTIVLVLGILVVLNFMASRYPKKFDMTKNKVNTLSEQSVKLVKGMQKTVHATVFAKPAEQQQLRPLMDNYRGLNPKFEVEYVDPDKEPTRAKAAGIKRYGTVLLTSGTRENKIEPDVNEEKLTNALIKILKDKTSTLCVTTGHGEKSFSSNDADGMSAVKKALGDQSYDEKDISIIQEGNKIPAVCDAVAIVGPTKSFFEPEIKALEDFFENGGRGVIAVELNPKGGGIFAPELIALLAKWNVKVIPALIVDPFSRMLGVDASVPILTEYNKQSPITKDFAANSFFPISMPLDLTSTTPGLTATWLAKTSPKSWGITDLKSIISGRVSPTPGRDLPGPLTVAASVEGKVNGSKASRKSRLVVFGSAEFATNQFERYGSNVDFFMNGVSWLMEDESLISIRAKEEGPSRVDLSVKTGSVILWITVILIPLVIAASGVVIWALRRRL